MGKKDETAEERVARKDAEKKGAPRHTRTFRWHGDCDGDGLRT
jgi:hypothetical protein